MIVMECMACLYYSTKEYCNTSMCPMVAQVEYMKIKQAEIKEDVERK